MPATWRTARKNSYIMLLRKADIVDFKNIGEASLDFSPKVNCVLGRNAMGKSNLLEAVHFLSFVRGFRNIPDSAYVRHGAESLLLKGEYMSDDGTTHHVSCGVVPGRRKSLKCDGKEYKQLSRHIGRIPLVLVAPQDTNLVTGSGQERRRFMDMVISQADAAYLARLVQFARALESRNRMLRSGIRDALLYESVEQPLCQAAAAIHSVRRQWAEALAPIFSRYHRALSAGADDVAIRYRSALNDAAMPEILESHRQRDAILGYTSQGVHRDDLEAMLGDHPLRGIGSQGQLKTFTVALKLAVFDYLRQARGETPILLLDDIFDKLDASRVEHILSVVGPDSGFGQIFITDTNREHLDRILSGIDGHLLFQAENGAFARI